MRIVKVNDTNKSIHDNQIWHMVQIHDGIWLITPYVNLQDVGVVAKAKDLPFRASTDFISEHDLTDLPCGGHARLPEPTITIGTVTLGDKHWHKVEGGFAQIDPATGAVVDEVDVSPPLWDTNEGDEEDVLHYV